jgi:hypothetical protein
MMEESKLDQTELPAWLRFGLEASQLPGQAGNVAPPVPSVTGLHDTPAWSLLLDAALASSFLPMELAPGHLDGKERAEAERRVLDFADPIQYPGGVRWMLTSEARTRALEVSSREEVADTARLARDRFVDGVSVALRHYVAMEPPAGEAEDLPTLEAERTALSMLGETPGLPSLEALDRQVQLRRLLAGFERMTGAGGRRKAAKRDSFFGREEDLAALRNHVDVLPIDGIGAKIGRLARSVKRGLVGGAPPLAIWGTGGVGKTTLMAKFMLEHAQAASDSYPFAYLDFDRSTVSARDPIGLLNEMCRQVAVQFGELAKPLSELVTALGETGRRVGTYTVASGPAVRQYQQRFREIVDEYLERHKTFSRSRPLLLVFDTFEVVQYSSEDVKALEVFAESFAHSGESRLWPRLRLVIAGRRPVEHFLGKVTERRLGPLDEHGATLMLVALASDLSLSLREDDALQLVKSLAKAGGNPREGVHPLRLRLVGEVFRHSLDEASHKSESVTGQSIVESLIADLSNPESDITAALINGFLVRRILNHLIDDDVRALADPGLVVRLITPAVISNVLAGATAQPVKGKPDTSDSTTFAPWNISPTDADRIFAAFSKEVTLVDADPPALRFRQDVRREMIPLIRSRRPNRFRLLHGNAWKYFTGLADKDPKDFVSAGEAVYHGLWNEDLPLDEVDRYWRSDQAFQPRIDPEEFEPGSRASLFLAAKVGGRLKPEEVGKLGGSLAWEWLLRQSDTLLQGSPMTEVAAGVRAAVGGDLHRLNAEPALAATASRLLFRTGEWADAAELAKWQFGSGRRRDILRAPEASLLRTWLTIICKSGSDEDVALFKAATDRFESPLVMTELVCHVALAGDRDFVRDGTLEQILSHVDASQWRSEPRILRLVILVGKPHPGLLQNYFQSLERLPREEWVHYTLRDLIRDCYAEALTSSTEGLYYQMMEADSDDPEYLTALDGLFRVDRQPLFQAFENPEMLPRLLSIVVADHSDWIWPLQFSLDRWLGANPKGAKTILAKTDLRLSRSQQMSRSDVTGGDIVSAAIDAGKLLELATVLSRLDSDRSRGGYPDTAGGIAKALLGWDKRLRAIIEPPPKPKRSSRPKPKRKLK